MTTMITEVYDALRDAGADEDKSRRAAEVLANYDDRFNRIEARLTGLEAKTTVLAGKVTALQLLVGANLTLSLATVAMVAGLFVKLFVA